MFLEPVEQDRVLFRSPRSFILWSKDGDVGARTLEHTLFPKMVVGGSALYGSSGAGVVLTWSDTAALLRLQITVPSIQCLLTGCHCRLELSACHSTQASGLPRWLSRKESTRQCGRLKFDPWVWKEVPQENEMAIHFSILAWKIHGQRSLESYIVHDVTKSRIQLRDWTTTTQLSCTRPDEPCSHFCTRNSGLKGWVQGLWVRSPWLPHPEDQGN